MKKLIALLIVCLGCGLLTTGQHVTGLLGAFPAELVLLQSKMENKTDTIIQKIHFIKGLLNGKTVVLAQTGVGKVNAAITTTLMIEHFNPGEIIFSGIAGGIDTSLAPGDIVIATKVAYHDYGIVTDTGMAYGPSRSAVTMQLNPMYFNSDSNLIDKAVAAAGKLLLEKVSRAEGEFLPVIKKGIIVTGDVFVSAETITRRLRDELHAAATEMEGAAIAQTCFQQNIPCLIIRSLSDKANGKARKDMMSFYEVAARNAAMLVIAIVGELK
ncbi:MAG: 5'-methylthioadenosine/adenosylhomocysteine nucleosidase [Ferruginibacter sp.]